MAKVAVKTIYGKPVFVRESTNSIARRTVAEYLLCFDSEDIAVRELVKATRPVLDVELARSILSGEALAHTLIYNYMAQFSRNRQQAVQLKEAKFLARKYKRMLLNYLEATGFKGTIDDLDTFNREDK